MGKTKILDANQIDKKLNRLAYQVYERNFDEKEIVIIGIEGNGYKVAEELCAKLKKISDLKFSLNKFVIDKKDPWKKVVDLPLNEKDFTDKVVLIVDDVLNSGKTLMYAMKPLLTTPIKRLDVLVLVDRSHSRYPVHADYVGLSLATTLQDHIDADFSKKGSEAVYLV